MLEIAGGIILAFVLIMLGVPLIGFVLGTIFSVIGDALEWIGDVIRRVERAVSK